MKDEKTKKGKIDVQDDFPQKKSEKENTITKIQEFIQEKSRLVIGISIGIIVLTAAIVILKNKLESDSEKASNEASVAISRVLPYAQALDFQKALYGDPTKKVRGEDVIGLTAIADKYSNEQGKVAALYAANCLLNINKNDDATRYFEKALKADGAITQCGANAGLGDINEKNGNYKEAIKFYQKATELAVSPQIKNRYNYYTAVCLEKSGDKQSAEKIYRAIIDENASEFVGMAKGNLVRLGTEIE
jgi:tetratricopeptide (TPR) repeat protein